MLHCLFEFILQLACKFGKFIKDFLLYIWQRFLWTCLVFFYHLFYPCDFFLDHILNIITSLSWKPLRLMLYFVLKIANLLSQDRIVTLDFALILVSG